jgi:starch synthase
VHEGGQTLGSRWFKYSVIREKSNKLGFDLYLIDINGLLDREKVYGYDDDRERFISFQIAVCDWISRWQHKPDMVHCHDHQTGFIPFLMYYCYAFNKQLAKIRTVFTIHNGEYQGQFGWDKYNYIPSYNVLNWGKLDWNNAINPMASGVKSSWRVTTVSPGYMEELRYSARGLEALFEYEKGKCSGILNGIDTEVWNPSTDAHLIQNYDVDTITKEKKINKEYLCHEFGLDASKPLICFIGRLVNEKAADMLPEGIGRSIYQNAGKINFLILGSGDSYIEREINTLAQKFKGYINCYIGYNETLSHIMYAGCDFLLMPSRVEPCGLNQLYALRYGTIPMVRKIGGLKDTVKDFGEKDGFGITMDQSSAEDIAYSVKRAIELYNDKNRFDAIRKTIMAIDHSWDVSAEKYIKLYEKII